jgi:hypothetical protein
MRPGRLTIVFAAVAASLGFRSGEVSSAPAGLVAAAPGAARVASVRQVPAATPELLLDQGRRLFDAFQYDQAVPLFDRLIALLAAGGQVQRPEILQQAYELRGRARFALNDQAGAEQDFSALLAINPGFKLGAGISPRVVDGRPVELGATPQPLDLPAGEHQITATRPGHRGIDQKFLVVANESVTLALTLERITSTLAVTTVPADVEVLIGGVSQGRTSRGDGDVSAPLLIDGLAPGTHRLILRKPCFRDLEHTVEMARPDDFRTEPLRLTPTVATVRVEPNDAAAVVFLDGARRGTGAVDLANVCEGPHLIEVRGAKGRFIDRRDWKTGDNVTLRAELRSAFPIVLTPGVPTVALDRLRANVERALGPLARLLIYFPAEADLQAALKGEDLPADWLGPERAPETTGARLPPEVRRDIGRKLAGRLETQGVAAIGATGDPNVVTVTILAAGSGVPESVTVNLPDPASRALALEFLGAPLPPVTRAAIDASVIDVAGIAGAVVVRTGPAGAKAGLAAGDVITATAAGPVASVADLRQAIASAGARAAQLTLKVRTGGAEARTISGTIALAPDTWPPRDPGIPYNRAVVDLQAAQGGMLAPMDLTGTHLNLAIVHMRLGNWDEALQALAKVTLPEGSGVSAGTVHYLTGLCHEGAGRTAESRAAFTRAAASPEARLSQDGPLIAPLAQRKIKRP